MHRFYVSSTTIQSIIHAKTAEAAKMLFSLKYPGLSIEHCLKMGA